MKKFVAPVLVLFWGTEAYAGCRQVVQHHVAQQVVQHQAVVAVAPVVAVPVVAQTYYQVGYGVREEAREEQIAQRVAQLLAGQFRQAPAYTQSMPAPQQYVAPPQPQKFTQPESQPCPCIPNPALTPTPAPQPPVVPEAPVPAGNMTANDQKVQAVFNASCVKCHNGTQAGRTDLRDVISARGSACKIFAQVWSGKMPKGGPALDDLSISAITDWAAEVENSK